MHELIPVSKRKSSNQRKNLAQQGNPRLQLNQNRQSCDYGWLPSPTKLCTPKNKFSTCRYTSRLNGGTHVILNSAGSIQCSARNSGSLVSCRGSKPGKSSTRK